MKSLAEGFPLPFWKVFSLSLFVSLALIFFLLTSFPIFFFFFWKHSFTDIKNRFKATYGEQGKRALALAMNEDFARVLKNQMVELFAFNSLFLTCFLHDFFFWSGSLQ
jgi:hypothetical protein